MTGWCTLKKKLINYLFFDIDDRICKYYQNANPWTWDPVLVKELISGNEMGEGPKNH